jgi:hypothetical protein
VLLVELDVFSGRPNPRWELDEPSAKVLRQLLRRLPITADSPPEPAGLGYRGFVFTDDSGPSRAYKGYVIRTDVVLADPSLTVERFLLDRLPTEFQELGRRVALELERVGPGA